MYFLNYSAREVTFSPLYICIGTYMGLCLKLRLALCTIFTILLTFLGKSVLKLYGLLV